MNKPPLWKYAAVKIDKWWQVVAINVSSGWMIAIAYFPVEKMAEGFADIANDMEQDGDYSEIQNIPEYANNVPTEKRDNIVPFRFLNHLTDWSEEQDRRLTEMWEVGTHKEDIAKALGRTRQAIERRARYIGLPNRSKILDKFERGLAKRGAPTVDAVEKIVQAEKVAEPTELVVPDWVPPTVRKQYLETAKTYGEAAACEMARETLRKTV